MAKVIVNKAKIALFLRERGIPASEAIRAAVIIGDAGVNAAQTADAFADINAEHFDLVDIALHQAHQMVIDRDIARAAAKAVA